MNGNIADLHVPVLRSQVVRLFSPLDGKTIVDGTVGLGGHSEALLESSDTVRIIGIDQDSEALVLASQRLAPYGDRFLAVHGNFRDLESYLADRKVPHVDGVLLDIGISSLQLDSDERGFSFRREGPLDMRMDRHAARTARDWLRDATGSEIAEVLFRFGEERYARRIARSIVAARDASRIETTTQLADIVRRAVPSQYEHGRLDAATRTFQAIRIFLNDELGALDAGLAAGFRSLRIGGMLLVISFHSLEDRRVKQFFREKAKACICPPELPECMCDKQIEADILTPRPLRADAAEIADNPRARSARLRAAVRLG
jgi:16S rRNA (cytosine1402-N4)-methyltransferase